MSDFPIGFFTGLFLGFIITPVSVLMYADIGAGHIRAAEAVCELANSTLVSLDRTTATCANRAEIPYESKR